MKGKMKAHRSTEIFCQESKDSYKEFLERKKKKKELDNLTDTLPPAYPKISTDFSRNIKLHT